MMVATALEPALDDVAPRPGVSRAGAGSEARAVAIVVSAQPIDRILIADMLRSLGYVALSARTGEEAAHRLRCLREPVDVVLADVSLPGMSGLVLLDFLALSHPSARMLLMIDRGDWSSAFRRPDLRDRLVEKPMDEVELEHRIEECRELTAVAAGPGAPPSGPSLTASSSLPILAAS